jgi:hypothetical protein
VYAEYDQSGQLVNLVLVNVMSGIKLRLRPRLRLSVGLG